LRGLSLILGERLTSRELLGCALMLGAVILSQAPIKEKKRDSSGGKEHESEQVL
jgi:hypothetical protein